MELSELQTRRDTLLKSIAGAYDRLQNGDKSVSYQSISQMQAALGIIDSEIEKAQGTTPVKLVRFYTREY